MKKDKNKTNKKIYLQHNTQKIKRLSNANSTKTVVNLCALGRVKLLQSFLIR